MSYADSNKLKLVALAGPQRSTLLPDVPTLKELGLPQVDGSNWLGIVAPAGVPPALAARIRQETLATLQSPELKKAMATNYMEVVCSTPAEFAATIDEDIRRWKPLIEKLAISMD
jgi:tripartite-type tricarboxylate transporter receptor subunit TctC